MLKMSKLFICGAIIALTCGCGGGGSSSTSGGNEVSTNDKKVGTLKDAVINGITYKSKSHNGITTDGGKFNYKDGEAVTFYVGNIEIGKVSKVNSDKEVTVQDIVKTSSSDTQSEEVVALATFLQSLDATPDDDNVINITLATRNKFDTETKLKYNQEIVATILTNYGIAVKEKSEVIAHLKKNTDKVISPDGSSEESSEEATEEETKKPFSFTGSTLEEETVSINRKITFYFSKTIKSIDESKIILSKKENGSDAIACDISFEKDTVTLTPKENLDTLTKYYCIIKAGAATDNQDETTKKTSSFSFKTNENSNPNPDEEEAPKPDAGTEITTPKGKFIVLTQSTNDSSKVASACQEKDATLATEEDLKPFSVTAEKLGLKTSKVYWFKDSNDYKRHLLHDSTGWRSNYSGKASYPIC